MAPLKPIVSGQKFHRLTAVEYTAKIGRTRAWLCRCDCGNTVVVAPCRLLTGRTKSCGCFRKAGGMMAGLRHGKGYTLEAGIWRNMLYRCDNPGCRMYPKYGGRGVTVCDRWRGPDGLINFLADMGPRPSLQHSVDRYPDNDGPYSPDNCRWATRAQQLRNTRRNRFITFDGRTMVVADWARETGIDRGVIGERLKLGWSVERALTVPVARLGPRR